MGLKAPAAMPSTEREFTRWCRETSLVEWVSGSGSPEGVIVGNVGWLYTDKDGGAGTTLYVKESGEGTNTGWVAK